MDSAEEGEELNPSITTNMMSIPVFRLRKNSAFRLRKRNDAFGL